MMITTDAAIQTAIAALTGCRSAFASIIAAYREEAALEAKAQTIRDRLLNQATAAARRGIAALKSKKPG